MPGQHTQDIYKNVLERGKDLLSILHQKVMEAEHQISVEREEQSRQSKMSLGKSQALAIGYAGKSSGSLKLYAQIKKN